MQLELSDTQRMIRDAARAYARSELAPRAAEVDREGRIPMSLLEGLAELGLMAVNVPDELGGSGAGVVAYSLAMQEIARADASVAVTMAVTNMVGEVIVQFGSAEQRRRYVPALATGRLRAGSFALSEPEAGSDPGSMRTTARRDGDGWVLDGQKQWITSGPFADVFVVWARTGGAGTRGISCFLVDAEAPGLRVGRHEEKMGLRGSPTTALYFEGCRVPASALLGEPEGGFRIAMMALDGGRIGIASQALGIADGALEEAIAYGKERVQFGHPITDFQAIQWFIADSRTELEASRLLTMRAAWMKDRAVPFSRQAAMAKVFTTEAAWRVCDRALQMLGGYGYTRDFSIERRLRDVRVSRIYEGTSEIQRLVISRDILRSS
ncbi:MAG: acyl-CoA dehydrogenase family protein [Sandaracinaceae bacterium]